MKLDVEKTIKDIISEQFGLPVSSVTDDVTFYDYLGGDELDEVELLMSIEDEFDVSLDDFVIDNLADNNGGDVTVKMIVDYVKEKID